VSNEIKIHWAVDISPELKGNGYGYKSHSNSMKEYVSKIADLTPDAEDSVIITSPEFYYHRIPNKVNWLFTMFEGTELPGIYAKSIQKADFILTPSTWVTELFKKYFDPKRIFTVQEAASEDYTYHERKYPHWRPFRYLWVGAPNPRKGWNEIMAVWAQLFMHNPEVELYLKTTKAESGKLGDGISRINLRDPDERIVGTKQGNIILDKRDIPKKELIELYHSAHCFVFPTRGEGFGLTLAEAMRTGLPCISTLYSGLTDFFDDSVGYSLPYEMGKGSMTFKGGRKGERTYITEMAMPDVTALFDAMVYIKANYDQALAKGKLASELISHCFTWERSAEILVNVIKEHGGLKRTNIKLKETELKKVKTKKKVITMTAYKRPEYTKRVLDGLKNCEGIKEFVLMPHVEPGNEEVIEMIKAVDFMECDYSINNIRWDINENTFRALTHGFQESDFVIHIEDDTVPSPDFLAYMYQMKTLYEVDKDVLTICAYNKYPMEKIDQKDYHMCFRKKWFTPWGWGTWKDRWEKFIEPDWHKNGDKLSWDEYMNHVLRGEKDEVRPMLGRTQNIGAEGGRFDKDHAKDQFNKVWAGDVKIEFAEFKEVEYKEAE